MMTCCGCGRHHIRIGIRSTVTWRGEQWDAKCAFEEANKELEQNPNGFDLRRVISQLPCYLCGKAVGRQYEVHGERVCHSLCFHDIGGEG